MPNWCSNDLYIAGPDVGEVLAAIAGKIGDDATPIDFDKIVPMPASLRIESGSKSDLALAIRRGEISEWLAYPWAIEAGIKDAAALCEHYHYSLTEMYELGESIQSNIIQYGAPDWYEWSIANWGTKWNATDARIVRQAPRSAKLTFETAWNAPEQIVTALAEKFPTRRFILAYFERGMGFQGRVTFERGEEVARSEGDYHGQRGG